MIQKHIVVITKAPLEQLPPAISAALLIRAIGHKASIITSTCASSALSVLREADIEVHSVGSSQARTAVAKARAWHLFYRNVWHLIRMLQPIDVMWISGGETALALGSRLLHHKYILQLNEIYDVLPYYHHLLRYWARRAVGVVAPEECRAALVRHWYNLPRQPEVLPNKFALDPSSIVRHSCQTPNDEIKHIIESGQKILLYQGGDAGMFFHNNYGELFGFSFIFSYILLIIGIERLMLVEKTKEGARKVSEYLQGASKFGTETPEKG